MGHSAVVHVRPAPPPKPPRRPTAAHTAPGGRGRWHRPTGWGGVACGTAHSRLRIHRPARASTTPRAGALTRPPPMWPPHTHTQADPSAPVDGNSSGGAVWSAKRPVVGSGGVEGGGSVGGVGTGDRPFRTPQTMRPPKLKIDHLGGLTQRNAAGGGGGHRVRRRSLRRFCGRNGADRTATTRPFCRILREMTEDTRAV